LLKDRERRHGRVFIDESLVTGEGARRGTGDVFEGFEGRAE